MSFRKILHSIPDIYHSFLPEIFHQDIPPEPFSNCSNCPMIAEKMDAPDSDLAKPFSPHTKCCTFTPRIPNYMVGGILSDIDPSLIEGKERILERIKLKKGVIPNGIYPTKRYHDYYEANAQNEFGRSKKLRCPFFVDDKFNCTIWKYREAICSFWFCKHLASDIGAEFWKSVTDYLKNIQGSFIAISANECGLQLVDLYGKNTSYELDGENNSFNNIEQYSKTWGKWEGREDQYYIRCFEIVKNLSLDLTSSFISDAKSLEKEVEIKQNELVFLPEFLIADKNAIRAINRNSYQIDISSFIRPTNKTIAWSFQLPKYVVDYFDGNTSTKEIIRKLFDKFSTTLEPEIIISLFRHGILKNAKSLK